MVDKQIIAAIFVVILSISQASITSARTANFQYYTVEVPDDWKDLGPSAGPMRALDGTLQILPQGISILTGAKPNADGSPDMDGIIKLVEQLKKSHADPTKLPFPMVRDFATEDLGEYRSMMRGVHRMNPSTIIVVYYVIGPTYVVPFTVASKHSIDDTIAKLDPIFASLKWKGKP